jgi:hypothetical protein
MAFDWETFVNTGVNPALGWLKDYMGYNLQSNLSRQDYLQDISKIQTEYGQRRRGSRLEYDLAISRDKGLQDFEKDIAGFKDNLERGKIDYAARSELNLTKAKSDVFIGQTESEEKVRTAEELKRYKGYADALRGIYSQDPQAKEEIGIKSVSQIGEALNKMFEHQGTAVNRIGALALEKSQLEKQLRKAKPGSEEATSAQQELAINQAQTKSWQMNLDRIQQFQDAADGILKGLHSTGITEKGEIPDDKKRIYMDGLGFLETRYREKGLSMAAIPVERIAEGLRVMYPDIEITPEDLKFIDANKLWIVDFMNKQSKKK